MGLKSCCRSISRKLAVKLHEEMSVYVHNFEVFQYTAHTLWPVHHTPKRYGILLNEHGQMPCATENISFASSLLLALVLRLRAHFFAEGSVRDFEAGNRRDSDPKNDQEEQADGETHK